MLLLEFYLVFQQRLDKEQNVANCDSVLQAEIMRFPCSIKQMELPATLVLI
jgi:hypothetical protein